MRTSFRATVRVASTVLCLMGLSSPVSAAFYCEANVLCTYFIPKSKLPQIDAQQTSVWCWAATAQAIFRYYGYEVSQADIVAKAYGAVVPRTGTPDAMVKMLNANYVDANGNSFNVRTPKYEDSYGLLPGGIVAYGMQPGLTNAEVFRELRDEHPVFYSDGPHVMVLVGGSGFGANPTSGSVLDPAPVGGQWYPGVQATGLRDLTPGEVHGYFMAKVVVTPAAAPAQPYGAATSSTASQSSRAEAVPPDLFVHFCDKLQHLISVEPSNFTPILGQAINNHQFDATESLIDVDTSDTQVQKVSDNWWVYRQSAEPVAFADIHRNIATCLPAWHDTTTTEADGSQKAVFRADNSSAGIVVDSSPDGETVILIEPKRYAR